MCDARACVPRFELGVLAWGFSEIPRVWACHLACTGKIGLQAYSENPSVRALQISESWGIKLASQSPECKSWWNQMEKQPRAVFGGRWWTLCLFFFIFVLIECSRNALRGEWRRSRICRRFSWFSKIYFVVWWFEAEMEILSFYHQYLTVFLCSYRKSGSPFVHRANVFVCSASLMLLRDK